MPVEKLIPQDITLKFADDEATLLTAPDFKCQVQNATCTPVLTYTQVGATGCQGPSQSLVVPVPWTLDLTWLQDWTAAAGGLAGYANTNAGQIKYFSYVPVGGGDLEVTGQVEVAPVALGGDMGVPSIAGPVSWQIQGQPTITTPVALVAAADEADDDELVAV